MSVKRRDKRIVYYATERAKEQMDDMHISILMATVKRSLFIVGD